jgi:hypothetical protein
MRVGEVLLFLVFNAGLIFGLYLWQTRLFAKKLKRLRQEIQELEDLVVAIIEEFGEAVAPGPEPNVTAVSTESAVKSHPNLIANSQPAIPDFYPENSELPVEQVSKAKVKPKPKPKPKAKPKVIPESPSKEEVATLAGPQPQAVRKTTQPASLKPHDEPATLNLVMKSEEKRELIAPQKSKPKPKPKATAKPKSTPRRSVQSVPTGLKAPANQNAGEMALNPVSKLSSQSENNYITRQQQVINLAQQGLEVAEIARQLKMGQGEIQLILGLKKNMKERTEK